MARKIEVEITGDASSLHRALGQASSGTSKFGGLLRGGLALGAGAAGAAVLGLGYALKRGVDEFNSSQKATAQTNAVLKSTGGIANVTKGHVLALASSLSNMSGVDDQVVQSGENVLLTFRDIRNEAGKGNDIFDQATKATLDLSVAMGEDLKSAGLQVGKALNDPVKGLTALKRVGVQFTDAQAKLIQHLVDTGKKAEAQKIILGELRKEFGGSAKAAGDTLSGQLNKLKNAFDNAAASVIQKLLPYILKVANFAFPILIKAIQAVGDDISNAIHWLAQFADHFGILGDRSKSAGDRVQSVWAAVSRVFNDHVMPVIRQLQNIFQKSMSAIAQVVQQHGTQIRQIAQRMGTVLQDVGKIAIPILKFALTKVLPVAIGIAIDAIDKISFAISKVADGVRWIANHAKDAFDKLKSAAKTVGGWLQPVLGPLSDLLGKIKDAMDWIISHAQSLISVAGKIKDALGNPGGSGAVGGGGAGFGGHPNPPNSTSGGNSVIIVKVGEHELARALVRVNNDWRRQNGRNIF